MLTPDQLRALVRKYPEDVAYHVAPTGEPCLRCLRSEELYQFVGIRDALRWLSLPLMPPSI